VNIPFTHFRIRWNAFFHVKRAYTDDVGLAHTEEVGMQMCAVQSRGIVLLLTPSRTHFSRADKEVNERKYNLELFRILSLDHAISQEQKFALALNSLSPFSSSDFHFNFLLSTHRGIGFSVFSTQHTQV